MITPFGVDSSPMATDSAELLHLLTDLVIPVIPCSSVTSFGGAWMNICLVLRDLMSPKQNYDELWHVGKLCSSSAPEIEKCGYNHSS